MLNIADSNSPKSLLHPVGGRPEWGLRQTEADMDRYDYGASYYDPVPARWHVLDPLSELNYDYTPYVNSKSPF